MPPTEPVTEVGTEVRCNECGRVIVPTVNRQPGYDLCTRCINEGHDY